jgi:hypothetical protein
VHADFKAMFIKGFEELYCGDRRYDAARHKDFYDKWFISAMHMSGHGVPDGRQSVVFVQVGQLYQAYAAMAGEAAKAMTWPLRNFAEPAPERFAIAR